MILITTRQRLEENNAEFFNTSIGEYAILNNNNYKLREDEFGNSFYLGECYNRNYEVFDYVKSLGEVL